MNILVMGRRGLGKTTLAEWLAMQLNPNRAAFDPGDQYQDFEVRTSDLDEVRQEFERDDWEENHLSLAYIPPVGPDPTADQVEPYFNDFASLLWEFTGRHEGGASYSFLIDESSELQAPNYVNPWLMRFIRRAPRRERGDDNPVETIQTFHRPQDLNGIVESQVDEFYIFNMVKQRDLEVIAKNWGDDIAQAVRKLRTPKSDPPGRDVLKLDAETGEWEVITDSESWYVDLRKPEANAGAPRGWRLHELETQYGQL